MIDEKDYIKIVEDKVRRRYETLTENQKELARQIKESFKNKKVDIIRKNLAE